MRLDITYRCRADAFGVARGSARADAADRTHVLQAALASVALFLAGCAATPQASPRLETAIIEIDVVREAQRVEAEVNARSDADPPTGSPWFEVREGSAPVIVTAPHATKSLREGKYRESDGGGTAALAQILHAMTQATVLFTTYRSPSDPNFYDDSEFKVALGRLIDRKRPVLLIDLHGSHPFRPYDVDIGTMHGASVLGESRLVDELVDALRSEGLMNVSSNRFPAEKNMTITKYAAARGVPTLQLEISSTFLTPSAGDLHAHRFAQLAQALVRYVRREVESLDRRMPTVGTSRWLAYDEVGPRLRKKIGMEPGFRVEACGGLIHRGQFRTGGTLDDIHVSDGPSDFYNRYSGELVARCGYWDCHGRADRECDRTCPPREWTCRWEMP